jgi:hypothetical protein
VLLYSKNQYDDPSNTESAKQGKFTNQRQDNKADSELEPDFRHFTNEDDYQKSSSLVDELVDDAKANSLGEDSGLEDEILDQMNPYIIKPQQNDPTKLRSIRPKNQLIMKSLDNKPSTTKFKSAKETCLKGKLTKGYTSKDVDSSHGNKSNETFANTDDDKHEFEFPTSHLRDTQPSGLQAKTMASMDIDSSLAKTQNKSKLSLKSRAYVSSRVPNFNQSPDLPTEFTNDRYGQEMYKHATVDMSHRMSYGPKPPPYHRHSLPHKPMEFSQSMVNFTPSTNYSIPSSEAKMSIPNPHLSQNMLMQTYSPVPFEKFHSNSHESFHTVDNAYYAQMQHKPISSPNNFMNNTVPLPEMSSFQTGPYYPPEMNMQPYYNVNMASTGCLSNSSDYMQNVQPQMQYFNPNMGSTWPKIPQMPQTEPAKFSTIPDQKYFKNSKKTLNRDKSKFELKIDAIINGADKRTTLMIRNIPNKYNQVMLTSELDMNHQGLYDIIYLPIDPKNQCNCGYAFINVVHPYVILSLYLEFNGKNWRNFNSEKICQLTYGRLQGKEQLLSQLEGSGVMQQSDPSKKPLMLETLAPTKELLDGIVEDLRAAHVLQLESQKQDTAQSGYQNNS